MPILGALGQNVQTFDKLTLAAAWLSSTSNLYPIEVETMPKLSDCNALDPTSDPSSTVPSNSCKIETVLHDKTEQAKQNALAHLSQAQAALQEWRSALELEGVLHGEIHTYPHHQGITRHNFYPATPDRTGKKRRRYVSLESLPHYRADIARGRQCHQLRQISAQITDLMQSVRSLA